MIQLLKLFILLNHLNLERLNKNRTIKNDLSIWPNLQLCLDLIFKHHFYSKRILDSD